MSPVDPVGLPGVPGQDVLYDLGMFRHRFVKTFLAGKGIDPELLYHGIDPFISADNQIIAAQLNDQLVESGVCVDVILEISRFMVVD